MIKEERNQGLGELLAKTILLIARRLDYKMLFFYTSNLSSARWYLERGAIFITTCPFRNHVVTLMQFP